MTQYSGKIIRKNPVAPTQTAASGVWTVTDAAAAVKTNTWPIAGVPDPISRSLRFRQSASAYLNRTPSVASNRTTWTWSGWVKRGLIPISTSANGSALFGAGTFGANAQFRAYLFDAGVGTNTACIFLQETVYGVSNQLVWYSAAVLRDPSAWYHIVVAIDTTQATGTNRIKVYLNNVALTGTFHTTPSQNQTLSINNTVGHSTGAAITASSFDYLDGYLTEVNFVDGQQLTPSSFGTTDPITGVWEPMPYTGSYGTNGYYLNFKDNTSTTTLCYDYSGNSNNWTPNVISLSAGSTYDSMVDVPTSWMAYNTAGDVGTTVRGNYATLNPLQIYPGGSLLTISQGNLYASGSGVADRYALATMPIPSTGKIYFEATVGTLTSGNPYVGVVSASNPAAAQGSVYFSSGQVFVNGSQVTAGAATYTSGNVIGVAVDYAAGTVAYYKNNTLSYTATGVTNPQLPIVYASNTSDWYLNFGQRPFTYTPPTGFITLNTYNLPTPTIANGASYMAATLYTGNGSTQSIVNTVNSVSFQPDFVWIKNRSVSASNDLFDSVRGATKSLISNNTNAELTDVNGLTAFNASGFSVGSTASDNGSGNSLVGWQWNAGGSTVTNTSGSISSQVRASTTAGFSVVTYTGTGVNATVGHGLGVAPKMVILKPRSIVSSWIVWQTAFAGTEYIVLESTAAKATLAAMWNSTTPTSSVFSIGTNANTNQNAATFVVYCFAEVTGYSAFGSYTGNGSTDGTFVNTGFRPRYVLIKRTDSVGNWNDFDTSRNPYNGMNNLLLLNSSAAESAGGIVLDSVSNGFKLRDSSANWNASGGTYIYAAFAENPFKYSNAR